MSQSVDPKEIEHFSQLASTWWDETGPYKSLHQLNPLRLQYIRDYILKTFEIDGTQKAPLQEFSILDIGCGGGLLCEPLARLGANIRGIDATAENIYCAQSHADQMGLKIDYECTTAEDEKGLYDVVLAMEIVEHVADLKIFMESCCKRVRPGGLIFLSTLNRTWKSYLLGIVAAEYILGWVPKGTHEWQKFVTPEELKKLLEENQVKTLDKTGVILDPLRQQWILSARDGVNYMMVGIKG